MESVLFYGFIVLSLLGSLVFGLIDLKENKKPFIAIIKAVLINLMILGVGTLWWYINEKNVVGKVIRGMIYLYSFIGISLFDLIFIYIWHVFKKKQ